MIDARLDRQRIGVVLKPFKILQAMSPRTRSGVQLQAPDIQLRP